ncbi:hypothetical protein PWT90_06601 [Aphanocladium album]|nr:hypothetical protein PWT90_06601 [Aphanocladium album]
MHQQFCAACAGHAVVVVRPANAALHSSGRSTASPPTCHHVSRIENHKRRTSCTSRPRYHHASLTLAAEHHSHYNHTLALALFVGHVSGLRRDHNPLCVRLNPLGRGRHRLNEQQQRHSTAPTLSMRLKTYILCA